MFSEFQSVALLRDVSATKQAGFENLDFHRGDIGVLVDFLGNRGGVAIEFNLGKAHTADVIFIPQSDIRPIQPREIWRARPLNPHRRNTKPAGWESGLFDQLRQGSEVALTRDFPNSGHQQGDLGLITAYDAKTGICQIQTSVGEQRKGPLLTLHIHDIRLRERDELATVRKPAPTSPTIETHPGRKVCS